MDLRLKSHSKAQPAKRDSHQHFTWNDVPSLLLPKKPPTGITAKHCRLSFSSIYIILLLAVEYSLFVWLFCERFGGWVDGWLTTTNNNKLFAWLRILYWWHAFMLSMYVWLVRKIYANKKPRECQKVRFLEYSDAPGYCTAICLSSVLLEVASFCRFRGRSTAVWYWKV